jgi:hypothetical protein
VFAAALGSSVAPRALACTTEVETASVASIKSAASLVVDGHVTSATGVETIVDIDRVLLAHGRATQIHAGDSDTFDDPHSTCPFTPAVGDRLVIASAFDGRALGIWSLRSDGSAVAWFPTDPDLATSDAVLAVFATPNAPDTSTGDPAFPATSSPLDSHLGDAVVLLAGICSAAMVLRRTRDERQFRRARSRQCSTPPGGSRPLRRHGRARPHGLTDGITGSAGRGELHFYTEFEA